MAITDSEVPLFTRRLASFARHIRPAVLGSAVSHTLGLTKRYAFRTPQGIFSVSPVSRFGYCLLNKLQYEPGMAAVLQRHLAAGSTFVDLGSNEGYFAVIASKLVGATGRVVAVEPQSRLQPVIAENLRLNGCQNVTVYPVLVGAQCGRGSITLTTEMNPGASSMYTEHMRGRCLLQTEGVESLTLEALLDRACIECCDLMKVDIEGGEWDLFWNAGPVLKSGRIRKMAVEMHNSIFAARGVSGLDLHNYILSCGYLLDDSLGPWVYCAG
jgi:FkbM family methyltransferase